MKSLVWASLLVFAFSSTGIAACATSDGAALTNGRLSNYPDPFALNSGFTSKQLLVISNDEGWEQAWARLHTSRRPTPAIPRIDFAKQMVLLYALGEQRTGGYSVRISAAELIDDQLNVSVVITRPSSNCIVTTGLTSPVDLIVVPLSSADVVVVETEIPTDC